METKDKELEKSVNAVIDQLSTNLGRALTEKEKQEIAERVRIITILLKD